MDSTACASPAAVELISCFAERIITSRGVSMIPAVEIISTAAVTPAIAARREERGRPRVESSVAPMTAKAIAATLNSHGLSSK